ncbi:MAG: SMP-30/gluconolactonase/LRE family protein [Chloroflexi bacterium]|nr:SMP-30/gluconolactonase/LRE family protein [Chloroflexota bacterium]
MKYQVEVVAEEEALVGEGPLWDPSRQILYWTDIQGGRFWEFDPATGVNTQIHDGVFVAGVAVNGNGGLAVGTWEGVMLWRSDDDFVWLHRGAHEGHEFKLNDVIAGPDGSFYGGTGHLPSNTLFRFRPNGQVDIIEDNLGLCNGMGFSPDLDRFYFTDSAARTIYRLDYDRATGDMSNKRDFVRVPGDLGIPDGMTVDAEGYVWSAIWYGGVIIRFDPDGKEERRVEIPARQTSCAMFGGKDLDELYVTTATFGGHGEPLTGFEPPGYDFSAHRGGELYRVKLDIKGKPEFETDFAWPA